MLRAIIIDDEESGIAAIKLLIKKFIPEVEIVASANEALKGPALIDTYRPEIVFLDINMPFLNGFELLEKTNYKEFNLIFITAHHEFAIQAIKERALDYLLKPVDPEDLKKAIKRIPEKQNKNNFSDALAMFNDLKTHNHIRVAIPVKDGFEYKHLDNIIRLEANSNYTNIYLTDQKKHSVRKTLKEYESQLCTPNTNFMRVHESHIVNLNYVIRYVKEGVPFIVTKDNSNVPLSRHKKDEFLAWLKIN